MKIKQKSDDNRWVLLQREYAKKCKTEICLTLLIENWFENTKDKSLDELEDLLNKFSMENPASGRIIRLKNARGKYHTEPFYREYEISLSKPNRYPFIVVSEPFK